MPEFLENPSVLTKDKLKSQLVANNVRLPAAEQPKRVYVQLYLEHLTPLNRAKNRSPDFSSDEEREATPIPSSTNPSGRNRPGRKATKKTDKPRPEENIDPDIAKLSNEDLKEQLLNYGLTPGPILASTRKVYEKKLAKLIEQGLEIVSSTPLPTVSSTEDDTRQNGNTDSEYSDNEEEPRISLRLEKREPLKSKLKTPVTLRQQRVEQNENYTEPTFTEVDWTSGFSEHGPLQTVTRESARVSRQASSKRMGTAEQLPFDEAVISESTPIAETMSSSNQTLAHSEYEQFESRQVINKVPGNFKPTAPVLSISEFSDMSGRTPKKTLKDEVVRKTVIEERRTDLLKEMFPFEVSTPTGISASCRRPIRGAAGRPIELSDYRTEESFSSRFVPKYVPLADVKPEKAKKGHSISIWIKILLFIVVAIFLFLVYQAMETNQGNPFAPYLGAFDGSNVVDNDN